MKHAALLAMLTAAAGAAQAQATLPTFPTLAELDRLGREIATQACPRPQEVKSSFVPNPRRPDTRDEMRSTDCRGFRVAHYIANDSTPPRVLPMELVVEQPLARLDARLAPGASEASVRAVLGAPATVRGPTLGYALGTRDTLLFELFEGRVRAVTWSWDVD
jgi:hypothetical protein